MSVNSKTSGKKLAFHQVLMEMEFAFSAAARLRLKIRTERHFKNYNCFNCSCLCRSEAPTF